MLENGTSIVLLFENKKYKHFRRTIRKTNTSCFTKRTKDCKFANVEKFFSSTASLNINQEINYYCSPFYWDCKEFTYDVSSKGYTQRWYEMNELLDYDEKRLYFTLENNMHNINFSNLQIYSYIKEEGEGDEIVYKDYKAMPIFDANNTSTKYKVHDFVPKPFEDIDFTGDLPKEIYINNNNSRKTITYFIPNDITLYNYSTRSNYPNYRYTYSNELISPTPKRSLPDMTTAHIIECLPN